MKVNSFNFKQKPRRDSLNQYIVLVDLFIFTNTGLTIRKTVFAGVIHYGVFCTRTVLSKGTKFGPFKGRIINTSEIKANDDNSLMWEVRNVVLFYSISFRKTNYKTHTALQRNICNGYVKKYINGILFQGLKVNY